MSITCSWNNIVKYVCTQIICKRTYSGTGLGSCSSSPCPPSGMSSSFQISLFLTCWEFGGPPKLPSNLSTQQKRIKLFHKQQLLACSVTTTWLVMRGFSCKETYNICVLQSHPYPIPFFFLTHLIFGTKVFYHLCTNTANFNPYRYTKFYAWVFWMMPWLLLT